MQTETLTTDELIEKLTGHLISELDAACSDIIVILNRLHKRYCLIYKTDKSPLFTLTLTQLYEQCFKTCDNIREVDAALLILSHLKLIDIQAVAVNTDFTHVYGYKLNFKNISEYVELNCE